MLRTNKKIDYLRSIMRYYWGLPIEKVIKIREEQPLHYYEGINRGIDFTKSADLMDYLDVIIVSERVLKDPMLLKIVTTGNTTILDEDFMIDLFFRLCREKLAEYSRFSLSRIVDETIDKCFKINMYNTCSSELLELKEYLIHLQPNEVGDLWEVNEQDKNLIKGALRHLKTILLMKTHNQQIETWTRYIMKTGIHKPIEGEFDPREASKEIGLIYFNQFVGI